MNLSHATIAPALTPQRQSEVMLAQAARTVALADNIGTEDDKNTAGLMLERAALHLAVSVLLANPEKHADAIVALYARSEELK